MTLLQTHRAAWVTGILLWLAVFAVAGCRHKRLRIPNLPPAFRDQEHLIEHLFFLKGQRGERIYGQPYVGADGSERNLSVRFGGDCSSAQHFLQVLIRYYDDADPFKFTSRGVELRDSEGWRFAIGQGYWREYQNRAKDLAFDVEGEQALQRIRYNDPTYYLTLKLTYEYRGRKEVIDIPRINPIVERPPPDL